MSRSRRRHKPPPIPQANPDGTYLLNRQTGQEQFLSFPELSEVCNFVMETPEEIAQREMGKPNWRNDPTYDMRRKK